MGTPVPEVAVLRNTRAALRKFGLTMVGALIFPTIFTATGAWNSAWAFGFTLIVFAPAAPYTMRRFLGRYTIRGTVLEVRTLFRRFEIDGDVLIQDEHELEYAGHREVGQQIQRLAERPAFDSWPE